MLQLVFQRMVMVLSWCVLASISHAQPDTIVIGFGGNMPAQITSSDPLSDPENVFDQSGFLPNDNAASRFLAQATLGYNLNNINQVMSMGKEDWIEDQLNKPIPFTLLQQVKDYYEFVFNETGSYDGSSSWLFWEYAWWQYHMTSDDLLRQRVALALSEILVVSENSQFGGNPHALSDYYDILLTHAFGNYRDLLQAVTYSATMGVYLTFVNNPKTDLSENQFPDENYAREVMQLFTIGLYELNNDGTYKLDPQGERIPTYDNVDIAEFSKVYTGLTYGDASMFPMYRQSDTSYVPDMIMFDSGHEPGVKNLLNNFQIPDRQPVDGDADISDALDNLFNHPNVGPFIGKLLIQRLVTSNPPPEYVDRVAQAFNDNGNGVRGDMKAVIRAILLDPIANSCDSGNEITFGMLREPFIRYVQINKAFDASTLSGNYRNVMYSVEENVGQKPLISPSVFNFFQPDYQPLGPVEEADLVAPEFQITDSQTISGWLNGVYLWVIRGYPVEAWDIYSGEPDSTYQDEIAMLDFSTEVMFTDDDQLHILLDRLNLVLAHGRLSDNTLTIIKDTVSQFENETADDKERRARLAVYLIMSSPEYLINR